jgi:hypothetical protein
MERPAAAAIGSVWRRLLLVLLLPRWHYLHIGGVCRPSLRPHGVIEGRVRHR